MLSESEARTICRTVLGSVTAQDAEVSVRSRDYANLRFADNDFLTNGRTYDRWVTVTVWVDQRKAAVSTHETDEASLKAAVARAEETARLSPIDQEYVPSLGPQKYRPEQDYAAATARQDPKARAETIDGVIRRNETAGVIGAGFHQAGSEMSAVATLNGNFHYQRWTLASLSNTARTPDGGSSGYFLRNHYDIDRLDTERIAAQAVRKAVTSKDPQVMEAGRYTVILESQATADLMGSLIYQFGARNAEEGRSAFSRPGGGTCLGEALFDKRINLYSDPWHPDLPDSVRTDEGIPAEKIHLVRNGVVERLIYDRYWARKKGMAPTPGPVNQILESAGETASTEEMIAGTERGLLLGRFSYVREVDPRTLSYTGLTRDGVWYIEDGAIKYPVRNFRFNQSVIEALSPDNLLMVGKPERVGNSENQGLSSALLPALKIARFNFTSLSEAV
jgi:predicted Zn-dependent protease